MTLEKMRVIPSLEFTRIVQKIEGCILHSVSVSEKKDIATIWYSSKTFSTLITSTKMKYQSLNSTSSNPCLTLDLIQQRFKELSKKHKIILKTVVILLFLAIIIMAVKKPPNKPTSQNKPIITTTTSATTTTGNEICLGNYH